MALKSRISLWESKSSKDLEAGPGSSRAPPAPGELHRLRSRSVILPAASSAPLVAAQPASCLRRSWSTAAAATEGPVENRRKRINTEHWSNVPLDEGIVYLLKSGGIPEDDRPNLREVWLAAFLDREDELVRLIERYPRLIHKFPQHFKLCYGIVLAWEEHCLAKLTAFELEKHARVVASYDVCKADSIEAAVEAAQQKMAAFVLAREELERQEQEKQRRKQASEEVSTGSSGEGARKDKDELILELESNEAYLKKRAELEAIQCRLLGRVLIQGT